MNKFINKWNLTCRIGLGTLFLITMCISAFLHLWNYPFKYTPYVTDLYHAWYDENHNLTSLTNFTQKNADKDGTYKIYFTITNEKENQIISYYARNMYTDIMINDTLIEKDQRVQGHLLGTSSGVRWHKIHLPVSSKPCTVCLICTPVYDNTNGYINDIFLGQENYVQSKQILNHIYAFMLSTFFLLVSVLLLILFLYLRLKYHTGNDFAYLGSATFFSAEWASCESLLWQYFFENTALFHTLTYLALISVPPAFALIAVHMLEGKKQIYAYFYALISGLNLIATTVLHFTGIVEYHYSLGSTHILILLYLPLAIWLIKRYLKSVGANYATPHIICIFTLLGCLLSTLIHYKTQNYSDFSLYFRIAIISFLFCLITYHLNEVMQKVKAGAKAEMLHNMAITDTMTGMFNRRGYLEHQSSYISSLTKKSTVGIVMLDINNLKKINDTFGHEKGDLLISYSASAIQKAFSPVGKCYRLGGDEFIVILDGPDPEIDYQTSIEIFDILCEEYSKQMDMPFPIVVARGFAYNPSLTLDSLYRLADSNMYKNKKRMKKGL